MAIQHLRILDFSSHEDVLSIPLNENAQDNFALVSRQDLEGTPFGFIEIKPFCLGDNCCPVCESSLEGRRVTLFPLLNIPTRTVTSVDIKKGIMLGIIFSLGFFIGKYCTRNKCKS